jgi:O-methyltransferase involved in polyketide biosynthesis
MAIQLNGVAETMLIPLWARATETRRRRPIIRDEAAERLMYMLDYDFKKFTGGWMSQVGVSIRTMLLDREVEGFIKSHPRAAIVNIGAGLDTRFQRVDNGSITWYDLDLPEVIAIREQYFKASIRYRMVAGSVLEVDWPSTVSAGDRPVLIIAEGVLMYFAALEVKLLMGRLVHAFPGAEMLVELMPPTLVRRGKQHDTVTKTGAEFKWGLSYSSELEDLHPSIRYIEDWNYFDYHRERWRWLRWLAHIPAFRRRFNNRIAHLRFLGARGGDNWHCTC